MANTLASSSGTKQCTMSAALLDNGVLKVLLDLMTYPPNVDVLRESLWCCASLAGVDDACRVQLTQQELLGEVGRNLMVRGG